MKDSPTWPRVIIQLRRSDNAHSQFEMLQVCSRLGIHNPRTLKNYHDALLFTCAYPFSSAVFKTAVKELYRLAAIIKKHQESKRWQYALSGSGLPFSKMRCQFSADLIVWMFEKFPGRVRPSDADEPGEALQAICQAALPGVEFHLTNNGNWNTWNRIKLLSGHYHNAEALQWLLQLFKQQRWNIVLEDHLYDSLKIFVDWDLHDDIYNRTFLRWPVKSFYFHKKRIRKVKPSSVIRRPLTKQIKLNDGEKDDLISVIRSSLAFYQRETDPVTYADPSETSLFDMGEGLQIALTGMQALRRLSVESYIGFMAFRNGIPIAYGGGWIFGYRCEIGVNIYFPFRGGESEKLFCQVMRLYFRHFRVKKFIVKPYQFGKGNPEGLQSGAFWFYYKLGFRPAEKRIKETADAEWKKITVDKIWRTPMNKLKSFTACNVEWEPAKSKAVFLDADIISKAVTAMIIKRFEGNREKAIQACIRNLGSFLGQHGISGINAIEKNVWKNWGLIFSCLPATEKWNAVHCKQFLRLLQLKTSENEREFISALQRHSAFWSSVKKLLHSNVATLVGVPQRFG
jgi:hypothetical protein